MTIKCPHCGEICESDVEIQVGQHVECPFCANKFYYGMDTGDLMNSSDEDAPSIATPEADKIEIRFCGQCGTKIPAMASFCPGCGRAVLVEEDKVSEATAETDSTVETDTSVIEPTGEVGSASHGYFQRLLQLIVLTLVLSVISKIICCIDIRECYGLGRTGLILFEGASLGIQIWLYVALKQLKSWARKSLIVFNLFGAASFVLGIGSGFENLFVFLLSIAVCLIDLYCVYLCFQEDVVAVFKPDSELNDARAVVNTMHCFGFWFAEGLMIVACVIWMFLYRGTEAWVRDCSAAAVAGSSSARESLIDFVANQLSDEEYADPVEAATERIDSYIKKLRPTPSHTYSKAPRPIHILWVLKFLGKVGVALAAIIGGFFAKTKGK